MADSSSMASPPQGPIKALHSPEFTYRLVLSLMTVCAAQFVALVALRPLLEPVLGTHTTDTICYWANKGAQWSTLLVGAGTWLAGAGRSFKSTIDNPQQVPPASST